MMATIIVINQQDNYTVKFRARNGHEKQHNIGMFHVKWLGESEPKREKAAGRLVGRQDTSSSTDNYGSIAQGFPFVLVEWPEPGLPGLPCRWWTSS